MPPQRKASGAERRHPLLNRIAAAYKAAQAKDAAALAAVAAPLDQACTACHKQYRLDVFPRPGGSQ